MTKQYWNKSEKLKHFISQKQANNNWISSICYKSAEYNMNEMQIDS